MTAQRRIETLQARLVSRPDAHGSRGLYVAGCRCEKCTAANRCYNATRTRAIIRGDKRGLVSTERVVAHLRALGDRNIGLRSVSQVTDITRNTLRQYLDGSRSQIRQHREAKILAVDSSAIADHSLVSAKKTWKLLDELIRDGYTRQQLAVWLGSKAKVPSLQLHRDRITAATALRVERLYTAIRAGKIRRER